MKAPQAWKFPTSLEEATGLGADLGDDAAYIAGGTGIGALSRNGLFESPCMVSLRFLEDDTLHAVRLGEGSVRLGSLLTLADAVVQLRRIDVLESLATAYAAVGNRRIRNMATVGGSVAYGDTSSDPSTVLLALGARCHVSSHQGMRVVGIENLVSGRELMPLVAGELVTHVEVPLLAAADSAYFRRHTTRSLSDRAALTLGVVHRPHSNSDMGTLRVAIGSVGPAIQVMEREVVPVRDLSESEIDRVAEDVSNFPDVWSERRASDDYRRHLIRVYVARLIRDMRGVAA